MNDAILITIMGGYPVAFVAGWLARHALGPVKMPRYVMPRRWWRL